MHSEGKPLDMEKGTLQLIVGSRLIDGKGSSPIEQGGVLIEGTRIIQVGFSRSIALPAGARVTRHSFPGCTILPGLIDTHTHLNFPGDGKGIDEVMAEPEEILLLRSARNARIALKNGVTTLRDNGGRNRTTLSFREAVKRGIELGPRLSLCKWPITITGGHCWPMGGEADGVDGVRKAVRHVIKEGADYIKVMATGGGTPGTFPFLPSYTREELRAAVDEAHHYEKLAGVHCLCTAAIENAVEAGADILFHCTFREPDGTFKFRPDLAERIAKAGIWVNPTLHVIRSRYWAMRNRREREGPSPKLDAELHNVKIYWENWRKHFKQLLKAGIKMAGADSGWENVRFGEFVYEIEAMQKGGLSTMEAIVSATQNAAESMGMGNLVGTLQPQKEADILVVRDNPLEDIMNLMQVEAVFKAGEKVEVSI